MRRLGIILVFFAFFVGILGCGNDNPVGVQSQEDTAPQVYVFLSTIGKFGEGDGEFNQPQGIAVDKSGNLYVADVNNSRIQKFTSDGIFLRKWGCPFPKSVAVDSSGNVYTISSGCIQKFTSDGIFLRKWALMPKYLSSDSPIDLAVDGKSVYAVPNFSPVRGYIQKFSLDGAFIKEWETWDFDDPWYPLRNESVYANPSSLSVDRLGYVYVLCTARYNYSFPNDTCIQKFSSDGIFLGKWATSGIDSYQIRRGIAVDNKGSVYVLTSENFHKYSSSGKFLYRSTDIRFKDPYGIAVFNEIVYIVDCSGSCIQEFGRQKSFE